MRSDCPDCGATLGFTDIDAAAATVLCPACGARHPLARLATDAPAAPAVEVDPATPPPGAWLEERINGFRAGAHARSCLALFLIPFTCVWGGASVGGIYGGQIARGEFDPVMSLVGLPFLLGSIALTLLTLFCIFGRTEITVDGDEARVFTGCLGIGRRRTFDWRTARAVRLVVRPGRKPGQSWRAIEVAMADGEPVVFGSPLTRQRQEWLVAALGRRLAERR